jgi:site-specific DNA recombinase
MTKILKEAVIYARFSPRPGGAKCESIEKQLDYARRFCALNDYSILAECADRAISGATRARPGLVQALRLACDAKASLVVYSLSRMARNTRDALEIADQLRSAGADMASVKENIDTRSPMGRFIFTLLASLAELERQQISARTSDAIKYRIASGLKQGGSPPYGYGIDPFDPKHERLILDPREQRVIREIMAMTESGMTPCGICKALNAAKTPARGKKWHHRTVQKIIHRTRNVKINIREEARS